MRLVLALAVVLALPGQALAAETSPGVSLVGSIPERGVISAKAVDRYLYVSALTGVSIYDIGDPRAPVRVGRLELPNAQNEDVDVGSGIMLVSDDPFGGRGVLHVIDVRDPANPTLLSTFRTWTPGLFNFARPPRRRGIGHTASCIQDCRYAWLAGSSEGIDVIDLRDPAHPRLAGRFPAREAAGPVGTHDVQVDASGLAWVAGGNGTAAYDVSNPVRPRLVKRTGRRRGGGLHHNSLRLGHGVLAVTEEDFGPGCRGAGRLETWRITARRRMTRLDSFGVERDRSSSLLCSAHYFDARDGLIAQGFYEQGVRLIDARRPGRLRQVGYFVSRPGLYWGALFAPTDPTGSTVYALDHSRGIDVLALDRAALQPVRRSGSKPRGAATDFGLVIDDGLDVVGPGRRLRLQIFAFGQGGGADVQVTLPAELVDVRPPRGVQFDAATRTLRFTIRRLRGAADRRVRARVARGARAGTQLDTIGYVNGPGDALPLNDRGVDRSVVGRRAVAAAAGAGRPSLCALPSDYTL
jgi:LVIVD repeat